MVKNLSQNVIPAQQIASRNVLATNLGQGSHKQKSRKNMFEVDKGSGPESTK